MHCRNATAVLNTCCNLRNHCSSLTHTHFACTTRIISVTSRLLASFSFHFTSTLQLSSARFTQKEAWPAFITINWPTSHKFLASFVVSVAQNISVLHECHNVEKKKTTCSQTVFFELLQLAVFIQHIRGMMSINVFCYLNDCKRHMLCSTVRNLPH